MTQTDADQIAGDLRAGIAPLQRRLRSLRDAEALGDTATEVLTYLHDNGQASTSQLSAAFQVKPGSMTQTVARLLEGGFVSRSPDPGDGRRQLLTPTPAGDHYVRRGRDQRQRWLAERIISLGAEDRELLAKAAPIILRLSRM